MSEVLEIAKEMGYKEDYEGEGKKTPAEFIKHSSQIISSQSGKLKDVIQKMDGMSDVITDMQKTFNSTIEAKNEQHKADLAKQRKELEIKLDTAVDESDRDKVKEIRQEIKEIDKQENEPTKEVNVDQAYFEKWRKGRGWIEDDKKAQAAFRKAQIDVEVEHGIGNGAKFELEKIDEILKAKYPEQYGLKPKEAPPAGNVSGGEGKQSATNKALKLSDLTPDEKQFVDRLKRMQGSKFNEKVTLKSVLNTRVAAKKRSA